MTKTIEGFSLIELIMVMVILGMVASLGALGLSNVVEGYSLSIEGTEISQKGQLAISRFAADLAPVNSTGILIFESTRLRYQADYGNATLSDVETHTMDFNSTAGNLLYDDIVLSDMVQGVTFSYYQSDGTTVATVADDVRILQLEIVLGGGDINNKTFTARVAPVDLFD